MPFPITESGSDRSLEPAPLPTPSGRRLRPSSGPSSRPIPPLTGMRQVTSLPSPPQLEEVSNSLRERPAAPFATTVQRSRTTDSTTSASQRPNSLRTQEFLHLCDLTRNGWEAP